MSTTAQATVVAQAFQATARAHADKSALETIVCVDGDHEGTLGWDALLHCGSDRFDLEAAGGRVSPSDLLTPIYTSGTTGPPKGVELTHANVVATLADVTESHASSRVTGDLRDDAEVWVRQADVKRGSWWPDYVAWLSERSGDVKPAPKALGSRGDKATANAPGTNVHAN